MLLRDWTERGRARPRLTHRKRCIRSFYLVSCTRKSVLLFEYAWDSHICVSAVIIKCGHHNNSNAKPTKVHKTVEIEMWRKKTTALINSLAARTFCMAILYKSVDAEIQAPQPQHLCADVCVCWRTRNWIFSFNIHLSGFRERDSQTHSPISTYVYICFILRSFRFSLEIEIFKLGECERSPIQHAAAAIAFAYDSHSLVLINSLLRAQHFSIVWKRVSGSFAWCFGFYTVFL